MNRFESDFELVFRALPVSVLKVKSERHKLLILNSCLPFTDLLDLVSLEFNKGRISKDAFSKVVYRFLIFKKGESCA